MAVVAAEPDLLELLSSEPEIATRLRRVTLPLSPGPWSPDEVPESLRSPFGLLVADGFLTRDVELAGLDATELLGENDVVRPWADGSPDDFLPSTTAWSAFTPVRLVILDPALARVIRGRASLMDAYCTAAERRVSALATARAIAQLPRVELRLLTFFWHLAGRWGRVGPDGILVPLDLSHAFLGQLVGARRPTVSLALRELAERGHVIRRPDGTWQLGSDAPSAIGHPEELPRRRRRDGAAPAAPAPTGDPVDDLAAQLLQHVTAARARARHAADGLPERMSRFGAVREHSAEVRRQSEELRAEVERTRRQRGGDRHPIGRG